MTIPRKGLLAIVFAIGLIGMPTTPSAIAQQDPAPAEAAKSRDSEPFLMWMARSSGLIGVAILGMSFYLIALVAWMFFEYRRPVAMPPVLIEELTELIAQKKFTEAFQRISADPSFFARTLSAGMKRLPSGLVVASRAMEMANEDETMQREHRTTYLATVGTLGPMIGLVGTVYGMIRSFQVMATAGASPQAGALAEGISTALFATLEGISLSVPAIAFYALFRNRIARLSLEVAILTEGFLEQFAAGVRTPHPLVAASRPSAPKSEAGPA